MTHDFMWRKAQKNDQYQNKKRDKSNMTVHVEMAKSIDRVNRRGYSQE